MIDRFRKIADFIRTHCQADDYRLSIRSTDSLDTRFAQNAITQHIAGKNTVINLEVAFENRTGTAEVNQSDNETLKQLIDSAEGIARMNLPDPEFVPYPGQIEIPKVENLSPSTVDLKVETIVDNVRACVDNAVKLEAMVSGMCSRQIGDAFLATKNGLEVYDRASTYTQSMTMKKDAAETKVEQGVMDYDQYSNAGLIQRLNDQFGQLGKPAPSEKGRQNVILRPGSVVNLFAFLLWMMDRRSADEGLTQFTGGIGKKLFGESFTLSSRLNEPGVIARLFNPEGVIARDIDWVRKGVLQSMPTGMSWAKKIGEDPVFPCNFIIEGGDATEEEMMKKAGSGLIITTLWYIRFVDRKKGELTGMTRDGVLRFEDGKIVGPVTNLRFNEVLHEATSRILAMGPAIQTHSIFKVPALLIEDFNFVDTTTF